MRETTFVVNVSKQPESVTGTIGGEKVDFEAVMFTSIMRNRI